MLKTAAIIVSDGKDLLVFPADKSGLGYPFAGGLVPDAVLLEPSKAIKDLKIKPKIKMAWSEENANLVSQSIDGKGVDGKLSDRIKRELSKQMRDFTSLRDFFPQEQLEQFAVVAMMRTAPTTGMTVEQAKSKAAQYVSHQLVTDSLNALSMMGFTPNMKQLESKNPMRDAVKSAGIALADQENPENPTVDTEAETVE